MRAIILAQGSQSRLAATLGDKPKQLVTVNGEPMISRTLRLLSGRATSQIMRPETAAWRAFELARTDHHEGYRFRSLSLPGLCVVDGLRQSLPLACAEPALVLLGDVVWSRATLDQLVSDPRPLVFCGWSPVTTAVGEIYGVKIAAKVLPLVLEHCVAHVKACTAIGAGAPQPGHLRNVLWSLTASAYRSERGWAAAPPSCWLEADELTMDVDTPADLDELRRLEPAIARRD